MKKELLEKGSSHYKGNKIEPIEFIISHNLNFCEGNILKYLVRHKFKGRADDLRKLIHYAELLLEQDYPYEGVLPEGKEGSAL